MSKLDEYRKLIDQIDDQIISLYEKRMNLVKVIYRYKKENNIDILDSSRETIMLENNLLKIKNEDYKKYYKDVLDGFLSASKKLQKDLKSE